MSERMGNLVLVPRPASWVYDAYRKGKRVGIVLGRDLHAGKKRLHRGRVKRRAERKWERARAQFLRLHGDHVLEPFGCGARPFLCSPHKPVFIMFGGGV